MLIIELRDNDFLFRSLNVVCFEYAVSLELFLFSPQIYHNLPALDPVLFL